MESILQDLENFSLKRYRGFVGFDGFVDSIMRVVDQREEHSVSWIQTLPQLAQRIHLAAGKSTNLECVLHEQRMGGNGPLFANTLLQLGLSMRYMGALGHPNIHPLFKTFADQTQALSLCEPGYTQALEFHDGKLLLGQMEHFHRDLTLAKIFKVIDREALKNILQGMDLLAFTNWTMILSFTDIMVEFGKILSELPKKDSRLLFFDLADPEKRPLTALSEVLNVMSELQKANLGRVVLSLNVKEAQWVARALKLDIDSNDRIFELLAKQIRQRLGIFCVVIHPLDGASCSTEQGETSVQGFFTPEPFITTGGGDHFNGGFIAGLLGQCSMKTVLTLGCAVSGVFVRTGQTPNLQTIKTFLGEQSYGKGLSC